MTALREVAMKALKGVGDPSLGEWEEPGDKAYHVRRRLTEAESRSVGPVVDVRGTDEAIRRFRAVQPHLPTGWTEIV